MLKRNIAVIVLVVYLVLLPLMAVGAYQFLGNTKLMYNPPKDTIVEKTNALAEKYFTNQIMHVPMFLLVESKRGGNLTEGALQKSLCAFTTDVIDATANNSIVNSVEGYCLFPTVKQMQKKLIGGPHDDQTLISVDFKVLGLAAKAGQKRRTAVHDHLKHIAEKYSADLTVQFTSEPLIIGDLQSGMIKELLVIDMVSMPLAIAVLAVCLGSLRLLIIPAVTVPVTVCFSFGLCYPMSLLVDVSSFAPQMASACMLAISIDYSLFILSRFKEQAKLQEAKTPELGDEEKWLVVFTTAKLSAHNIVVSGVTIAVALGGLVIIPVKFVGTIGYVFFISALCAVVVSLTLQPAILMVLFNFFRNEPELSDTFKRLCGKGKKPKNSHNAGDINEGDFEERSALVVMGDPDVTLADHLDSEREAQNKSWWFKIGLFAFHRPVLVAIAVLAVGAPFIYLVTTLKVDFNLFHTVPLNSKHAKILNTIVNDMGKGGSATPFYVTVKASHAGGLNTAEFFNMTRDLAAEISQKTGQPMDRLLSWAIPPVPKWLHFDFESIAGMLILDAEYRFLYERSVDKTNTLGLISIFTSFDPYKSEANAFLDSLTGVIKGFDTKGIMEIGYTGASAPSYAIMHEVLRLFPIQIGATFSIIFLFIAGVFRSAFIPLRMLLTVAYTVAVALGLGVAFFQYDWTHSFWTSMVTVESYSWTVPIFAFSLLCALALDYDVFLLTRLAEFKKKGFSDEAAMAKAVWKTGRIITCAGLIMAIAFGSLVFSEIIMLRQFGFVASSAVLLDTFVVRTFFVPALMSIFPRVSWWPRKFPDDERGLNDMNE
jgi:uncharacterized membrane protein YdfJ with MMPL/SSD domain